MQANRRTFLTSCGLLSAGIFLPRLSLCVGRASQVELTQMAYSGGNWRPRPTALRRLSWEIHKRCAVDAVLEPSEVKAQTRALSLSPFVYFAGDRPFSEWAPAQISPLRRFLKLGGTLVIDTAMTPDGDARGFEDSVDKLMEETLPKNPMEPISPSHVLYRTFYQIDRPVGRIVGPPQLTGCTLGDRLAVIRSRHDLGGAWARDNLGNWEYTVEPGGERQRESAFRLGVNIVLYALCLDYKDEEPHRRFGRESD